MPGHEAGFRKMFSLSISVISENPNASCPSLVCPQLVQRQHHSTFPWPQPSFDSRSFRFDSLSHMAQLLLPVQIMLHPHGKNITQTMIGCDFTEQVRVINKGAKTIHRMNNYFPSSNFNYGGIIWIMQSFIISSRGVGLSSDKARVKTPAPTLQPQPQRIAIAEISFKVSGLVNALIESLIFFHSRQYRNFLIKRRSIQSFHHHSNLPETV